MTLAAGLILETAVPVLAWMIMGLTGLLAAGCGNEQLLFHSTSHFNAYGILARGLMLPTFVVGQLQGRRTDAGRLGT